MYLLPRMMLLLLLSAGPSLAVDKNRLTGIVAALQREYQITVPSHRLNQERRRSQFCVAVNIPEGQDPNTLMSQVLQNDRYSQSLQDTLDDVQVYKGTSMVLAVPAGPIHAEVLVLQNLDRLRNAQGKILVIYSFLSPCSKCTDPTKRFSIIRLIQNKVLNRWHDYAFVFTALFTQPGYSVPGESSRRSREELEQSLTDLGNSGLGLSNIFRCYRPQTEFQCYSCSSRQQVTNVCVDDNAQPQQGASRSNSRSRSSSSDRSRSSNVRARKRPRCRTQSGSSSGSDGGRNWDRSNRRSSRGGTKLQKKKQQPWRFTDFRDGCDSGQSNLHHP